MFVSGLASGMGGESKGIPPSIFPPPCAASQHCLKTDDNMLKMSIVNSRATVLKKKSKHNRNKEVLLMSQTHRLFLKLKDNLKQIRKQKRMYKR